MVKAYHGERYTLPWAGDVAEKMIGAPEIKGEYTEPQTPPPAESPVAPPSPAVAGKVEDYFKSTKAQRITGSSFAIAWSIVLLVFFNLFYSYIAYYHSETIDGVTRWTRYPFFTEDIHLWLPILTTTLALTIIGHIILIIFDRYTLHEIILLALNVLSLATVLTLLSVFPFDFSVIPNATAATATHIGVIAVLICISIGIGVATIARIIRFIIRTVKQSTSY